MQTIILCGGKGTRIRDVSEFLPKPMVPIGGLPIIWHIMKIYSHFGFDDFVLTLGYKGEMLKDFFIHYGRRHSDLLVRPSYNEVKILERELAEDWQVICANTGVDTLTAGRVRRVEKYIAKGERFFLTYGDGLADIDIAALLDFHQSHGKILTITAVHPPGRFGEMQLDAGSVCGFHEKPESESGWINGGFFVCEPEFWDFVRDRKNDEIMLERDVFENLVKAGEVMAYRHKGFWQCMDTQQEHIHLNKLWDDQHAPWKMW